MQIIYSKRQLTNVETVRTLTEVICVYNAVEQNKPPPLLFTLVSSEQTTDLTVFIYLLSQLCIDKNKSNKY